MDAQFSNILKFMRDLDRPQVEVEPVVDLEQEEYNKRFVGDEEETIDSNDNYFTLDDLPDYIEGEGDVEGAIEPITIEPVNIDSEVESLIDDLEEVEKELEPKQDSDVMCWRDTISFVNSAKRSAEFLAEVMYNTERWIGSVPSYEEYTSNGMYHILGITGDGLIVTLEYTNLDDEVAYVTITISNDLVSIVKVEQ